MGGSEVSGSHPRLRQCILYQSCESESDTGSFVDSRPLPYSVLLGDCGTKMKPSLLRSRKPQVIFVHPSENSCDYGPRVESVDSPKIPVITVSFEQNPDGCSFSVGSRTGVYSNG